MKISIVALLLMLNFCSTSYSQTEDYSSLKRNGVYLEGYLIRHDFSEGFVSLNYERNLGKKHRTNLRVGIYPDFESTVSFPVTVSWITRPLKNHHFEYGIGAIYRLEKFTSKYNPNKHWYHDMPALMIPLMYRYQSASGFYFRGGANVFVSWPTFPSPSLSAGYRF